MRVGLLLGCVQRVVFGERERRDRAGARGRGLRGRRAARPAVLRRAAPARRPRRGGRAGARRGSREVLRATCDAIVVNAAGCGSHLKDADLPVRVVDVNELLAELEPRAAAQRARRCGSPTRTPATSATRRESATRRARCSARSRASSWSSRPSRRSAAAAPGSTTSSSPRPPRSSASGRRRTSRRPGADAYASANPGCLVQVSTYLRRRTRRCRPLHPVEILDASIRGVGAQELLSSARR